MHGQNHIRFVIVASSWFLYITLPTMMMHGQTQMKPFVSPAVILRYLQNTLF